MIWSLIQCVNNTHLSVTEMGASWDMVSTLNPVLTTRDSESERRALPVIWSLIQRVNNTCFSVREMGASWNMVSTLTQCVNHLPPLNARAVLSSRDSTASPVIQKASPGGQGTPETQTQRP